MADKGWLKLLYPTTWYRNIPSDIEDKKFCWFVCSRRYYDTISKFYVVEIASKTKFFNERNGETLIVPVYTKNERGPILLITDDPYNDFKGVQAEKIAKKYGYQGLTRRECPSKTNINDMLCCQATFLFFDLSSLKRSEKSSIIDYAKHNFPCLSKKIDNFPTPDEIDQNISKHGIDMVSLALYKYFS